MRKDDEFLLRHWQMFYAFVEILYSKTNMTLSGTLSLNRQKILCQLEMGTWQQTSGLREVNCTSCCPRAMHGQRRVGF